MVDRLARCLAELVYNKFGCGQIRVAHGEIDNIDILVAELFLDIPDDCKRIGGKALYSVELEHNCPQNKKARQLSVSGPLAGMTGGEGVKTIMTADCVRFARGQTLAGATGCNAAGGHVRIMLPAIPSFF